MLPSDQQIRVGWRSVKFAIIPREVIDSDAFRGLTLKATRVLNVLALFAGQETRTAWPKQSTIAGIAGLSRQSVNLGIRELVTAGLLSKRDRGRVLMTYELLVPGVDEPDSVEDVGER